MPRNNIELYWQKAETATEGVIAQVLVTDGNSSDYLLPYPCTLTAEGGLRRPRGSPWRCDQLIGSCTWRLLRNENLRGPAAEGGPEDGVPRPKPTTGKVDRRS
jgi:hypothetical protein